MNMLKGNITQFKETKTMNMLKGSTRLNENFLLDCGNRVSENYNTEVGKIITSNSDYIEGFEIVDEIEAKLEEYVSQKNMKYFYPRVTFCQEADWHVDTFSYSVMIILKSNGHTVQIKDNGECSPKSCEVVLLRSDVSHRLVKSDDDSSFIFVAFDIPREEKELANQRWRPKIGCR